MVEAEIMPVARAVETWTATAACRRAELAGLIASRVHAALPGIFDSSMETRPRTLSRKLFAHSRLLPSNLSI
jgi:hypothetical protein